MQSIQPPINLVAKTVVPPDSLESIRTAYAIGERQSVPFVEEQLIRKSVSLYGNIKLNVQAIVVDVAVLAHSNYLRKKIKTYGACCKD